MANKTLTQLEADVIVLTARVVALETSLGSIVKEQAARATRLSDLEQFVEENRTLISDLAVSDEASGWKAWRENQKAESAAAKQKAIKEGG